MDRGFALDSGVADHGPIPDEDAVQTVHHKEAVVQSIRDVVAANSGHWIWFDFGRRGQARPVTLRCAEMFERSGKTRSIRS